MKKMGISTKVRLTNENGHMSDRDYTIVDTKKYNEVGDYCNHYIVRDDDGRETEVRESACIFPPREDMDDEGRAQKFLEDNGVYAEVYRYLHNMPVLVVDIQWGDWKHEHGWSETLMKYLGYREIGYKVTEEDGSDCYSAEHYFLKG